MKGVPSFSARWVLVFLSFISVFQTASGATGKILPGHVPKIIARLQSTGHLSGETKLKLAIGLPLRHPDELSHLLQAIYDPSSPQYHHYLSPEEFTEKFGPTPSDYQAIIHFAETNGFTVRGTHSDRMLLEVAAASKDAEKAFHITLNLYQHPSEARTFFSPDVDPSVDAELPVADISGLNNYLKPHPKNLRRTKISHHAKNTSQDGSGPDGNFIGSDYRQAYMPGTSLTGAGQTVGLLEYDNFYPTDISSYESMANLTNPPPVQTVLLDGYHGVQGEGDGEVALDVEMVMSVAPGLSGIICYEAPDTAAANVILSSMASATTVKQFSCSWDFGSNPRTTMDQYFEKFAAQGQSFFDACGDGGAYTGAIPEPDDDPYITVVGGTALLTSSPNGSWLGEITWNAPDLGDASSGGISATYALPTWQTGIQTTTNKASSTHRNVPDVAMIADNVFTIADDGQEESAGGTSAAAPAWAAFTALVNQQSIAAGHSTVGFINPALYQFYTNIKSSADFDDVTFGNNTNSSSATAFFATPGYDLCTGLGTPAGSSLIIALASPDGFVISPARGFTADGPIGGPFDVTTFTLTLTNTIGSSLNWSCGGQPSWLSVSALTNKVTTGSGSATVTVSLNALANTLASNVYTANLWFTNLANGQTQLRQFTLRIQQNLIHDGGFEAGDFCYWTLTGPSAPNYNLVDNGYYTPYSAHSGVYFAALGEDGALACLSQPIATTEGAPYLISFWMENPSGDAPNQFQVELASSQATNILYTQSNLSAFVWENRQFVALAPSTNTLVQFVARDDPDYLLVDDVSVIPVPLPTVQSIQVIGSAVQISWTTLPSVQYQVQSASDLSSGQWTNLGNPITATTSSAMATESISGAQQFYRILVLL